MSPGVLPPPFMCRGRSGARRGQRKKGPSAPSHSQFIAHPGACGKTPVMPQDGTPKPATCTNGSDAHVRHRCRRDRRRRRPDRPDAGRRTAPGGGTDAGAGATDRALGRSEGGRPRRADPRTPSPSGSAGAIRDGKRPAPPSTPIPVRRPARRPHPTRRPPDGGSASATTTDGEAARATRGRSRRRHPPRPRGGRPDPGSTPR